MAINIAILCLPLSVTLWARATEATEVYIMNQLFLFFVGKAWTDMAAPWDAQSQKGKSAAIAVFIILQVKISVYWKLSQQSVRHTSLLFGGV